MLTEGVQHQGQDRGVGLRFDNACITCREQGREEIKDAMPSKGRRPPPSRMPPRCQGEHGLNHE
jgi:hypothetical protein